MNLDRLAGARSQKHSRRLVRIPTFELFRGTVSIVSVLACLVAVATSACKSENGRHDAVGLWGPSDVAVRARTFAAGGWDTLWSFPSARRAVRGDSAPRFVVADNGRVYVFDEDSRSISALDAHGQLAWDLSKDRPKSKPLGRGIDIKLAPDGTLHVLDPENSRIVVVSRSGKIAREIPLAKSPRIAQIAFLDSGQIVLMPILGERLTIIDGMGKVLREVSLPWPGFARLAPLARQGGVASNGKGDWVFAFSLGDGWFSFHNTNALPFSGKYVEYRPFPAVDVLKYGNNVDSGLAEYSPCTGCSVALTNSSMYVLAGGSKSSLQEVIDEFDLQSGLYVRSYQLPSRMIAIAVFGGVHYVITPGPNGRVIALRSRSAKLGSHASVGTRTNGERSLRKAPVRQAQDVAKDCPTCDGRA